MAPFDFLLVLNCKYSFTVFFSYLMLSDIMTLKSGSEVTQGHSNRHHSKACVMFPIRLS